MEDEYMESQDVPTSDANRNAEGLESTEPKEFADSSGFDDGYEEEDGGNNFRGNRGRGNFRNRGRGPPPPGWMNGPPMRFRGRGYGPGGPPMRGRGFFRGRGGPRFGPNGGPNFDNNWGPMGPPPPGMMGGPPPFGPPPGMMPPGGPMGPPPNMMGQPPPFGGPPGMPPPNMPAPELWVETKSDDDKSYYYHSRTRETTWTRPQEGPNVKVITQAEMEVIAGNQLNMNAGSMPMNGPMGGPPMGMMPNGMMGGMMPPQNSQPVPGVPPFLQPPPWGKNAGKDNKDEPAAAEADDMPPGETAPGTQPANGAMGGFPGGPGGPGGPGAPGGPGGFPGGFPGGAPPGGFPGWGGWGGWPPPLVAQPPPGLAAAAVPDASAATQMPPPDAQPSVHAPPQHAPHQQHQTMQQHQQHQQHQQLTPQQHHQQQQHHQPPQHKKNQQQQQQPPQQDKPAQRPAPPVKKEPTVISPELIARAAEWTTHRAPDGRPYYYRASKQESVWEKPKPLKELEELKAKIALEKGEKENKGDAKEDKVIDVDAHAEAAAAVEAEVRAAAEREKEKERAAAAEKERQDKERQDKEKQEKEAADKEKAKQDRRLPISTTPISGTPWCLVWTGDGRVFFHNPTALSSVWERPPQLVGRADVDHALSHPPPELLDLLRKDSAAGSTTAAANVAASKAANGEMKRTAEKSESDSDAEPPKKPKPEETKKAPTIDVGKEAAIEAEVRAARERGVVPHEQRLRSFLQMLHEKDVSAFSTWEKELHKIVFDPRYLMLNSKERRQVFDQYVRERAEEERKEKKNRLQQKKLAFKQLMEEAKLHSKSSFTDFSSKHGRDERFKGIEKPRDRETCFNEFIADLRKRDKEEKEKKREQVKADFISLLKEKAIDRHSRWADTKKKIDSDARYKAVETSSLREDYFREYCKMVKEERKKDKDGKEKERSSSKKEKKDKERGDKDKEKDKEKDKDKERDKEAKKDKKKDKGEQKEQPAEEMDVEDGEAGSEEEAAAREREARAQASIKEREREVQRALATSLRDRDKEREYHKRDEAVQHFNALLADLVRNPDLTWREAKKQLKKDHRYSLAELLSKDDKERLFGQHTSALANKRRDKLRALLAELNVSCTAHWRDVRDQLAQEPTAPTYSSATQMEREFRDYQRDKQSAAKTALRQLLLETRSITHKSLAALKDNPAAEQHIHDALKHDARYLALDHIPDERQQMILGYLEELEKKGPPPPPTATEPTRRTKQ